MHINRNMHAVHLSYPYLQPIVTPFSCVAPHVKYPKLEDLNTPYDPPLDHSTPHIPTKSFPNHGGGETCAIRIP